jgi:hypothetical protein
VKVAIKFELPPDDEEADKSGIRLSVEDIKQVDSEIKNEIEMPESPQ